MRAVLIRCKKHSEGADLEGVYRRAGGCHRQLHYRPQCDREADGKEVRDQQEYGTCGGNNIERIVWVIN